MGPVRSGLERWFLPILAVFLVVITAMAGFDRPPSDQHVLTAIVAPLVMAGGLFVLGYHGPATGGLREPDRRSITRWTLVGLGLAGVAGAGAIWMNLSSMTVVTVLTGGALTGGMVGLVGIAGISSPDRRPSTPYREVFDKANVGIAVNDPERGTIGMVNERYAALLGYSVDELDGMRIDQISADDPSFDQEAAMAEVQRAIEGESRQFDWLLKHRDGSHVWAEIDLKRTTIDGETRLLAFLRDITERKEREREREFFEKLVEAVGIGVGVYGSDGRFVYVNEAYAESLGTDRETLEEMAVWEVNPEVDPDRFDDYWASFEAGETRTAETVHAVDGQVVPVRTVTTSRAIGDKTYHLGTVQDITERKEHEQRFQAFVEQSSEIVTILDVDGTYRYQSPSFERTLGYEFENMVGENAFEYVHPADRDAVESAFERMVDDPSAAPTVEYRYRHADGSWRWLESRGTNQFESPAIEGFVINSQDITERKVYERQVTELLDATRAMIEATDEGEVCEIAVRTAESILEFPITGIWLRDESGERLEPIASTEASTELFGDHPVYTDGNSLSWQAYQTGETLAFDALEDEPEVYNPETKVKSELIIPLGGVGVLNTGSTEPNAFSESDATFAELLGANTHVALERLEREQNLHRQTDQMEFFNSILRHDVLNAVTVIRSRAEFLKADLEGEALRDADTIVKWCDDVNDIVQRVRTVLDTLTGMGDPQLKPMELGSELRAELDRVRMTYPDVSFDATVPDGVTVQANDLLGDVFGNILTNAVDHNEVDGLRVAVTVDVEPAGVVVSIRDNGRGVPDDRKDTIFRRDETGHAKSTGSGFGLFFVDVMVGAYGGEVHVEDNDEGGATFVLHLLPVDSPP